MLEDPPTILIIGKYNASNISDIKLGMREKFTCDAHGGNPIAPSPKHKFEWCYKFNDAKDDTIGQTRACSLPPNFYAANELLTFVAMIDDSGILICSVQIEGSDFPRVYSSPHQVTIIRMIDSSRKAFLINKFYIEMTKILFGTEFYTTKDMPPQGK